MNKPIKTNRSVDLNDYIKKSHIRALENFKAELEKYKTLGDPDGTLYEDPYTSFTLDNIILVDGELHYDYDGKREIDVIVRKDEETGEYFEDDGMDGLMETVKFWRKCLKRAQRYWYMPTEQLDAIQDGEVEDEEEED
jgi:hypothetical protein